MAFSGIGWLVVVDEPTGADVVSSLRHGARLVRAGEGTTLYVLSKAGFASGAAEAACDDEGVRIVPFADML